MWIQFSHLIAAWRDVMHTKSWKIKFLKLFCGPGTFFDETSQEWREHDIPSVEHVSENEFQPWTSGPLRIYVVIQFVLFLAGAVAAGGAWNFKSWLVSSLHSLFIIIFFFAKKF